MAVTLKNGVGVGVVFVSERGKGRLSPGQFKIIWSIQEHMASSPGPSMRIQQRRVIHLTASEQVSWSISSSYTIILGDT
jgi:hypothetical protein